ncbi:MAG: hypothetical protein ABIH84_02305 [bacterium]
MKGSTKKFLFIVLSLTLVSVAYFLASQLLMLPGSQFATALGKDVLFIGLICVLSVLFVQFLEGGERGFQATAFVGGVPFFLVLAVFFFFVYYPNVSTLFKVIAGVLYALLLYTLLLLNNVLLVVKSREDIIPVYRVTGSWVQIVLLSISVPLFIGVHRLPVQPLLQSLLVALLSWFFFLYLIWVYSYEKEIKQLNAVGSLLLASTCAFLTAWASFATLFFPGETYLRGLFIASVFLLGLGYIQLFLKNALSRRGLWDYLLICLFFFGILVAFKP